MIKNIYYKPILRNQNNILSPKNKIYYANIDMSTETKRTQKYIINPNTKRPIKLYSKQHLRLIKQNILKDRLQTAPVLTFNVDEHKDVIHKAKQAIPKKAGVFTTVYKNKIISKNVSISQEQLIEYIVDNYPNILEQSMEVINDDDDETVIKKKFSDILHKKLLS